MTIRNVIRGLAVVSAMSLALTACGSSDGGDNATGNTSKDLNLIHSGTLTVCSDAPYKPFDVIDGAKYTGFDGDLVTAIAEDMGLKLTAIDSAFDPLESGLALKSGQCDMAASAMTVTPKRQKNLAFSDGYYDSKQSLLVPVGSDITGIADLAGKKVAVQTATTGKTYTEEHAPDAKIVSFPGDPDMFTAIKGGTVDALLQDYPVNYEHTKDGKYKIVEAYDTKEVYGFAFAKSGSDNLVAAINASLAKLRANGKYDEIYNLYFPKVD